MERIPINFDQHGKKFIGYFSKVAGAGASSMFHLMDSKNFYCGRLRYSDHCHWVFDAGPKDQTLVALAEFFGDYLIAWHQ